MKIKRTERQKEEEYLAYQSLPSCRRVAAGYLERLAPLYRLLLKEEATTYLSDSQIWDLAGMLLDFAADLSNEIGLWDTYEQYNRRWFGTPLPLTLENESSLPKGLHLERIRHWLWVMIPEMTRDSFLAPDDKFLEQLSQAVYAFLNEPFHSRPKKNGIKAFLQTPNNYAWDIKRKLVWLGSKSYLFRLFYRQYLDEENEGKFDIGYTDDFICQQCTAWSGLGVIDILAGVLDLPEEERKDLRGWYERHAAIYLILAANQEVLTARNIINDESYTIRMNDNRIPFKPGFLVIGSLTSWRGEWYWSGQQQPISKPTPELIAKLKDSMIRKSPNLIYRYCPEREQQARKLMAQFHAESLKFHGTDLKIYPDGLAMAADWQREMRQKWESQSPQQIQEVMDRHQLKNPQPDLTLPPDLLEAKNGLGVFLNPEEGKEIMEQFDELTEGCHRQGVDLTQWQEEVIRGFIRSESISPSFVLRVIKEYGDNSLKSVFRLQDTRTSYWLDYLLRRYKGHFFRKRYPAISVV